MIEIYSKNIKYLVANTYALCSYYNKNRMIFVEMHCRNIAGVDIFRRSSWILA